MPSAVSLTLCLVPLLSPGVSPSAFMPHVLLSSLVLPPLDIFLPTHNPLYSLRTSRYKCVCTDFPTVCAHTHTHTCRFQFRFPTRENTSYTNGHPSFLAWLLSLCSVSWLSHLLLEARFLFTTEEKCLYHPGAVH